MESRNLPTSDSSRFLDWYGNDLAGGSDEVPITIIEGPIPTATPAPTATSLPVPTATPGQPAPTPALLPVSGEATRFSEISFFVARLIGGSALV